MTHHIKGQGNHQVTLLPEEKTRGSLTEMEDMQTRFAAECTHSGIARAKAASKRFGRPSVLNEEQQLTVIARINAGASISTIAREFNTTRKTILRVKAG